MRIAACAALLLMSAVVQGAEVYRSTNPDGTVTYSDRPQDANAEPVRVAAPRPSTSAPPPSTPGTDASRQSGDRESDDASTPSLAEQRAEQREQERGERRERDARCSAARERLQRYSTAHRLYRTLENGEREYLDDEAIDEARNQAAADVDTWCD